MFFQSETCTAFCVTSTSTTEPGGISSVVLKADDSVAVTCGIDTVGQRRSQRGQVLGMQQAGLMAVRTGVEVKSKP